MTNNIKATAKSFLIEFEVGDVTLDKLKQVIRSQGYTIIEYNHVSNSEEVESVITLLGM